MKLNLGAGGTQIDGYDNVDRKNGQEVYPLEYDDASVDVVRASHVLEHFSHGLTQAVINDWVRVLKPGGMLKIAVPDFEIIAQQYLAGSNIPVEGYVMGGHVDDDDHHGALFDLNTLQDMMKAAGLIGIERWQSEVQDCASLPISLNLQGYKPPESWPKVAAVMSVPRLGFMDNFFCAYQLPKMGIPLRKHTGAFWGQCLTRAIDETLSEDEYEYILTIDYDTIYSEADVQSMMMTMMQHPEIDALAPLQASRTKATPLMTMKQDGKNVAEVSWDKFTGQATQISTAHFGLTLIRSSKLRELQKPWFIATADSEGGWGDDRIDDDIHFWKQWEKAGFSLYLANRVAVGHAELMIRWPGTDFQATYQHPSEYWNTGKPEDVWT